MVTGLESEIQDVHCSRAHGAPPRLQRPSTPADSARPGRRAARAGGLSGEHEPARDMLAANTRAFSLALGFFRPGHTRARFGPSAIAWFTRLPTARSAARIF